MSTEKKTIYAPFVTFAKSEKAPKGNLGILVIPIEKFKTFLNEHKDSLKEYKDEKQIRFFIWEGKEGRLNFTLDTYKPEAKSDDISF